MLLEWSPLDLIFIAFVQRAIWFDFRRVNLRAQSVIHFRRPPRTSNQLREVEDNYDGFKLRRSRYTSATLSSLQDSHKRKRGLILQTDYVLQTMSVHQITVVLWLKANVLHPIISLCGL